MDNIQGILDDIQATDTTTENITAFKELLDQSQPETTTKLVVEKVLPYIFKSDTKNRKELLNLIFDCTNVDAKYLNKKDASRFKLHIKQEFLACIDKLGVENNSDWSILCIALFRILGKSLHNDVEIINRLLRIIEIGFRNKVVEQKCAAYKCWMELIRNYSLSPSYMRQPKQMKLLIKPLKVQLSRLSCATEIRFDTFMLLLEAIDCDMLNTYIDFLQFVFNIENVTQCKPTLVLPSLKNIWPKAAAVLFQSLGCNGSIGDICGYKTKICTLVDSKYFESNYKCLVYAARICSELTYQWCAKTNVKQIIEPLWTTIFLLSLNCKAQANVLSNINDHFNELFRSASSNAFAYDFILTTVLEVIYKESELNSATFRAEVLVPFLKLYIANSTLHMRSRNDAVAQLISFAYSSQTLCDLYPLMESLSYSEVLELIWFQCNGIFVSEVQLLRSIDILTYLKWPVANIKFLNTNQCILKLWKATLCNIYETQPDIISQLLDALKLIQVKNNWIIVNIMIISTVLLEIATRKITTMECIALTLSECLDNSSRAIEHFVLYKEDFFDSYLNLSKYMTGNSVVLTTMLRTLENFIQKLPPLIIKSIPKIFVQFMDESSRMSTSHEAVNVGVKLKPQALHSTPTTIISRAKKMASINYAPLISKPTAIISSSTDIAGFAQHNVDSSSPSRLNKKSHHQKQEKTTYSMNARTKSIMDFADTAFVQIDKEVTVDVSRMSSHQRESLRRRRDDIPALYADLSQSSSQTIVFSEVVNDTEAAPPLEADGKVTEVLTEEKTESTVDNMDVITADLHTMAEGTRNDSDDTADDNNDATENDSTPVIDDLEHADSENVPQINITPNDDVENAAPLSDSDINDLTDLIGDSADVIEESPKEFVSAAKQEDFENDVKLTEAHSDNVVADKSFDENNMLETNSKTCDDCEIKAIPSWITEKRVTRSRFTQDLQSKPSSRNKSPSARGRRKKLTTRHQINDRNRSDDDDGVLDAKLKVPKVLGKRRRSDELNVTYTRPRGRPKTSGRRCRVKFVAQWIRNDVVQPDLILQGSFTDENNEQSPNESIIPIQPEVTTLLPTESSLTDSEEGGGSSVAVAQHPQIATDKLKHELNRLRMDIVGGDMAAHITSKRVRKEKFNLSMPKRSPPVKSRRLRLCRNVEVKSFDELQRHCISELEGNIDTDVEENCVLDNIGAGESLCCSIALNDDYEFKGFEYKSESKSEIEKEYIRNELEQATSPLAFISAVETTDNVLISSEIESLNPRIDTVITDENEAQDECSNNIDEEKSVVKCSDIPDDDNRLDTNSVTEVLSTNVIMETQEPIDDAFLDISFIGSIEVESHKDVHTKDTLSIGIDEFETETCNNSNCQSVVDNIEIENCDEAQLIPSSPVSNTTPSKNKDFVEDTLDISPIGGTGPANIKWALELSGSPELFESETVQVMEKVLEELTSLDNDDLDKSGAQCTADASTKATLVSHLTPLKMQASAGIVSSPKTHRIQKMMEKLGDCSTPVNNEADSRSVDAEVYKKEDLLEFCADLPKPDATPRTPSILKRKAPDYLDEGISPASKRKRVNFSDPPTTSSKVYLKCDEENFMQRVLKKSGKLTMKPHYLNNDNDMVFNIKVNIKNNASTSEARIENDCLGTMKEITCETNDNGADELSDLYPDLIDCNEDIDALEEVTISADETGVKTIGDIVRLKRADVENLSGVPEPKFTRINSALSTFCCKHKNNTYEAQSPGNVHNKVISLDCLEKSISNVNIINNIILSPKQMDAMSESPSGLTAISQIIKNNIQQLVNEGYSPDDIGDELNNILRSCNLPLTINLPYY